MRGFLQSLSSLRHLDGFLAIFFPTTGCLDALRRPSAPESAASCACATRASCRVAARSPGHRVTPRRRSHGPLWASKRSLWAHGRRRHGCAAASWVRRRAQNGRGPCHDVWSQARVTKPSTRARGGVHPELDGVLVEEQLEHRQARRRRRAGPHQAVLRLLGVAQGPGAEGLRQRPALRPAGPDDHARPRCGRGRRGRLAYTTRRTRLPHASGGSRGRLRASAGR